ncbi:winged helix-turn-helix domain-containing protein [Saccharothrix luteola]|uniref:winged helix-turn-helix domain-containing protein n=1 Tax=Saccharothrix luteola TaxID=2893018 RepID=UPI0035566DEC
MADYRLPAGRTWPSTAWGSRPRRHGLAPQRPAPRAYGQQPDAVRAWLDEDEPTIADTREARSAAIAWVNRCGPRSDATPPARA